LGLDSLVMFHLNDSKAELGSKLDRHEHLGAGRIGAEGFRHLLTHPRLAHVTYYLETPGMDEGYDAINVARAYAIAAGAPLAALIGGGDPTVVVGEIAILGILAVGLVASLARAAAGPVAGIAAGLVMATSSTAVDESTFLWNPNLVAFGSALAVAAAWRAWTTG